MELQKGPDDFHRMIKVGFCGNKCHAINVIMSLLSIHNGLLVNTALESTYAIFTRI